MAKKLHFLFVCTGNSVRSQMAEGFMRSYGGESIDVESAGIHPVGLNPNAILVMNEVGIDISIQTSDSLQEKTLRITTGSSPCVGMPGTRVQPFQPVSGPNIGHC